MGVFSNEDVLRLTQADKLALISQLWDSLDDNTVLTGAQVAELDSRLASLASDRSQSVLWDSVRADLEQN